MLVFGERGKLEYLGKKVSEQSRVPTNSINISRRVRKSNPGHVGGRQVISPLDAMSDRFFFTFNRNKIQQNTHCLLVSLNDRLNESQAISMNSS